MNDLTVALRQLYGNMDVFALVFVRIIGFLVIMPLFSGQTIPTMVRVGFAFACSAIITVSGVVVPPVEAIGLIEYFLQLVNEFLAGFLIGFTVSMMFSIFHLVGQQTDFKIGFSMMTVNDPVSQIQIPVTGNLYYFVFLVLFVTDLEGFRVLFSALHYSYQAIPSGNALLVGNEGLLSTMVNMLGSYIELGLKYSMPILAVTMVIDAALGILVKAVPQMNVFVVGMPIKVGVGLLIIMLLVPYWDLWIYTPFKDILFENVGNVIRRMSG